MGSPPSDRIDCNVPGLVRQSIPLMGAPVEATTLVVLALVMAVVELLAGAGIGWWLRGSQDSAPKEEQPGEEVERARNALFRLHDLATRVAADVGEHSTRVQEMSDELTSHVGEPGGPDAEVLRTVARIIEANGRLQEQLKSAEVKLQEQAHEIEVREADALTDVLTGVANRRAFNSEIERRMAEWQRRGTPFCLTMVDVDHFKKFNDVHGHLAGDAVLRGVADSLSQTLREMDLVARFGGEEFAVIMPATTLAESEPGALRLESHVADSQFDFEGKTLKVTVSGGLAQVLPDETEADLIRRADEALYAAKRAGRNRAYLHDGQNIRPVGGTAAEMAESVEEETATNLTAARRGERTSTDDATLTPGEAPSSDPFRTDIQTGLPNRTAFCEEIRRRVAESHRYETKLSLMLAKVDVLEKLTGKVSGQATELVLRTVSQFLTAGMREMDLVARYYDDTFAVLLPSTPLSQALGVAERLRAAVARCPLRGKDFELRITISSGLAEVTRSDDWASFLKRSEAAMQASVKAGRDNTHFHNGQTIEAFAGNGAPAAGTAS